MLYQLVMSEEVKYLQGEETTCAPVLWAISIILSALSCGIVSISWIMQHGTFIHNSPSRVRGQYSTLRQPTWKPLIEKYNKRKRGNTQSHHSNMQGTLIDIAVYSNSLNAESFRSAYDPACNFAPISVFTSQPLNDVLIPYCTPIRYKYFVKQGFAFERIPYYIGGCHAIGISCK